ncbi:NAD(P)H-hydrate epimerase, partial [Deltaproteobacteria bacterium OttesenSCG-928-K17]|nr:NAD(P)H-hydrate epimerase [Deltaproteobacteria bacterium OttesenSCG-928-K17]
MYLATSSEMKKLDRLAIEDFGLPGIVLMENAARSIARAAFDFWPDWPEKPSAAVLIGPGQNGGDGWALARIFSARGFRVKCFLVKAAGKIITGDAAINMKVAEKLGLDIEAIEDADFSFSHWNSFDLLIDALFGTGLDRPITGPAEAVLKSLGLAQGRGGKKARVLAVDLPSGLSGDSGELWGPPWPADLTVTLGAPKVGLYLKRGPELAGKIVVGDIGLCP